MMTGSPTAAQEAPVPLISAYQLPPVLASHALGRRCLAPYFPAGAFPKSTRLGSTGTGPSFLTLSPGSLGTAGTLSSPLRELTSNFPGSLQRGLLCFGLSEKL